MKKIIICMIMVVISILVAGCTSPDIPNVIGKSPVQVTYYYSLACTDCVRTTADLDNLTQMYSADQLVITRYAADTDPSRFNNEVIKYTCEKRLPYVIIDGVCTSGYDENMRSKVQTSVYEKFIKEK